MSLIELKNVTFGYNRQKPILKDLSLSIESNSFWAVAGPNGAGKSTFLSLLTGQLRPQAGSILIEGRSVKRYNSQQLAGKLALVQQEFVPAFGFSVNETVAMSRFHRQKGVLFESDEDRQAVRSAMEVTDTLEFADRLMTHLSGGERQRVFIARALAQQTPILLLDEPTSHLDLRHQVRIFDLLKQMQAEQGKTILLVTHDINLASQYCDRVLLLGSDGSACQGSPEEVFDSGQIESAFDVKGYQGRIQREKFFIPLGRFSKDQPGDIS